MSDEQITALIKRLEDAAYENAVCHCGQSLATHSAYEGHPATPMLREEEQMFKDAAEAIRELRGADSARAVACVNACKGINPEAVPELLAACEAMLPFCTTEAERLRYASLNEGRASPYDVASRKICDAIARAKGGIA
jgi:hypothetical protein